MKQNCHYKTDKPLLSMILFLLLMGCGEASIHGDRPPIVQAQAGPAQNIHLPEYQLPDNIEGLLCRTTGRTSFSGYTLDHNVYMLFKNGEVFQNPQVPPEQFDIVGAKKEHPGRWGSWEKSGDNYLIDIASKKGKDLSLPAKNRMLPARPGERMHRKIYYSTSYGFAGVTATSSVSSSQWTFLNSGRFFKGQSSSRYGGAALNSAVVYSQKTDDQHGSSSVTTGANAGVYASSQKEVAGGEGNRGRYELHGHTLELVLDSGKKERKLFGYCFSDRADPYFDGIAWWEYKSDVEEELPQDWHVVFNINEDRYISPINEPTEAKDFRVVVREHMPLEGKSIEQALKIFAEQEMRGLGSKIVNTSQTSQEFLHVYSAFIEDAQPWPLVVAYYAAKIDHEHWAYVRLAHSPGMETKKYATDMSSAFTKLFSKRKS